MGARSTSDGSAASGLAVVEVPRVAYALSIALAVAAAITAAATYTFGGVLRGTPVMNGSCRGTALVMLVAAVPTLVGALWRASRGSPRAVFVWLGMTMYLAYNAVLIDIGTPLNRLFLAYETTLALAVAAAIAVAAGVNAAALAGHCRPALPARAIAAYLWVIVGVNALAWLGRIVPAVVDDTVPKLLDGTGVSMVSTYFQDLAIWLPLLAVAAAWLWRRLPWGYLLAGGGLAFWAVEGFTVAVDQWFGARADPTSTVASSAAVVPFAAAGLIGIGVLAVFLRNVDPVGETDALVDRRATWNRRGSMRSRQHA